MTVKKLKEMLHKYQDDAIICNEQNLDYIHIVNIKNRIIVSTVKPIGRCNRSGEYVYPSTVEGYSAFSPELNEDLYDFEWTKH